MAAFASTRIYFKDGLVESVESKKKPLPFRGGVGVGTVNKSSILDSRTVPTPDPSPEGEGRS
jgi:hypothetical protein